ncbi:DNA adenine methylase [Neobacillus sp. MM2021_6]|uniref:DNA adenine methylase n=1 Tax=Bacillaceae TaxID=186817 RepID=UPI00140B900E|nr:MULTISPECIES: DNA adenine methylase [Bacillaceae]MBO0959541.1 DNA adenine methylase [Neobacillus sp. MM2021_6]NHC17161.1 DNA adenine methylase [Bacillus sp. MM2020_4]
MKVRSPLIWFGGKSKYAEYIISKMPTHKKYIEPFGGAAHVIAQKGKINFEVYNDIDNLVVNFILQAIDQKERLAKRVSALPYSRALYEQWKREELPRDPFEKAVRFFYLNRCGISKGNAEERPQTGWRHSTLSGQSPSNGYLSACDVIESFADRMKGVLIENLDYKQIIEKYDSPDALFYVDPPYVGREKYYAGGFTEEDHRELARMLNRVRGKVIISYYHHQLIEECYQGWNIESFKAHKQIVGISNVEAETEEILLMNYKIENDQLQLF